MEFAAVRAIYYFLKPYPWVLPTLVILGIGSSFAEGIGIGLLIPLLDVLLHSVGQHRAITIPAVEFIQGYLENFSDVQRLLLIGSGITILLLAKAGLVFSMVSLWSWITGRINDDIRRALFRQMLIVDYSFLVRSDQGRIVSAFETQTWRTLEAMVAFADLAAGVCTISIFVAFLLLISWQLTLAIGGLALLASLLIGRPLIRRINDLGDASVSFTAAISRRVLNALNGMRVIRAFGQESREQDRFDALSKRTMSVFFRMDRMTRSIPPALEVAYAPIFLGAIVFANYLAIGVPVLLAFLFLFYRLQPHVRDLDQKRALIAGYAGALLELVSLLDQSDKPASRSGSVLFSGFRESIVFDSVGFHYQAGADSRRALSQVSAVLRARQTIAIVGASGAGKTTLINLLLRFYEPTEGKILVDGQPLAELDTASWRAHLALAGQDAALLDGTIAQNIAYGRPDASIEAIADAARRAAADDFIQALPRGYQTDVGDRGVQLSEGQRQRIGLARALLRGPEILILDEATNALDGLSEQLVHQALDQLAHKTTILLIAHRSSTIRKADHVIVLKDGKLAEQGSPEELFARSGTFADLHAYLDKESDRRSVQFEQSES